MLRPLILGLWVLIVLPRTPLELHKLPLPRHASLPKGKGAWGLWIWGSGTGDSLDSLLPGLSQAGSQAQGFHWRRLRRPPKDPYFLPTCAPAPGLQSSRASCCCAGSAHSWPGPGCTGEGLLGSRLASAADACHPVERSGRTAGGGALRPAVMDVARSGLRKAIYGARAHRDRFGPAE